MSGRHMNARPKRLTRKQKEALSAHGWDSRQYLFIQDSPDDGGWVLMNKTTGHYEVSTGTAVEHLSTPTPVARKQRGSAPRRASTPAPPT